MILPPIIIKVVVSKFFTESIRFETFEPISVPVFVEGDVTVFVVVLVVVVVKGLQYLGALCESMALARTDKGKLSLCFKRKGNELSENCIVRELSLYPSSLYSSRPVRYFPFSKLPSHPEMARAIPERMRVKISPQ